MPYIVYILQKKKKKIVINPFLLVKSVSSIKRVTPQMNICIYIYIHV